jgi:hypothetical protein
MIDMIKTEFMELLEELDNISESTGYDPFGYGPYKTADDPTLKLGDYIKVDYKRGGEDWYPGMVTNITPDFVDYEISGWGFVKNGTAVRSASAKQAFGSLRKRLLGEAADSNAGKKFWADAKNKQIDEVSFHAAYDEELTELGLMDIFNADGTFTNKGAYGKIKAAKDANPDSWAVKALSKLWALRYVDNILFKAEEDKLAAEAAEREKRAAEEKAEKERLAKEECEVLTQEHQALLPDALKLVDKDLLAKFIAAYETTETDINVEVIENFGRKTLVVLPEMGWGYKVIDDSVKDKPAKLANILNDYFKGAVERADAKQTAKKLESNKAIDIFNSNQGKSNTSCRAILLGESGKLYQLTSGKVIYSIDKLPGAVTEVKYLEDVPEPYKVIYTSVHYGETNYSTSRDTNSYTCESWDSSEEDKISGLIPVIGKGEGVWDYWTTTAITSGDGILYSAMDNIDSWAYTEHVSLATD